MAERRSSRDFQGSRADKISTPVSRKSISQLYTVKRGSSQVTVQTAKEKEIEKEKKDRNRSALKTVHRHLFKILSLMLNLGAAEVEDQVLDNPLCIVIMNQFLEKGPCRTLLFFYEECKLVSTDSKILKTKKVLITKGSDIPLKNKCIFFLSLKPDIEITEKNVSEDVFVGMISAQTDDDFGNAIILRIQFALQKIYSPLLNITSNSISTSLSEDVQENWQYFLQSFQSFDNFLTAALKCINGQVKLKECEALDLSKIKTVEDIKKLFEEPEKIFAIESLIKVWNRQIEQVISESQQIRKESDDDGPVTELEHWRYLLARYSSLIKQIKHEDCKTVMQILSLSKSKSLKVWKETIACFTDQYNEAMENVKYLQSLQKFYEPLYRNNLDVVSEAIPNLINNIQMIHSVSRSYNTSQHMTSLFVKVTNQLVQTCKIYLKTNLNLSPWDQPQNIVKEKMNACLALSKKYRSCFNRIKKEAIDIPGRRPFTFSEIYIFGRFDNFCKRLEKIIELIDEMNRYEILAVNCIGPLLEIGNKFKNACAAIKSTSYDFYDYRNKEIDKSITNFHDKMKKLKEDIQDIVDKRFEKINNSYHALKILKRFEDLKIPDLNFTKSYINILKHFEDELDMYSMYYRTFSQSPVLPRDMPSFSGKITWARDLFKKIEIPMQLLKEHLNMLNPKEVRKITRAYNELGAVLVEYEMIHHIVWKNGVVYTLKGLHVPILVYHPETKEFHINFAKSLFQTIREATCLQRIGLEIPENIKILLHGERELKRNFNTMKFILEDYSDLKNSIPQALKILMEPLLQRIINSLKPGTTVLTWSSLLLNSFFSDVKEELSYVRNILKEILDIMKARIDVLLEDIRNTSLIDFPEDEVLSLYEFIDRTKKCCDKCILELNFKIQAIHNSIQDLIGIFMTEGTKCREISTKKEIYIANLRKTYFIGDDTDEIDAQEDSFFSLHEEYDELRHLFGTKITDSIIHCIRHSLVVLHKRVVAKSLHIGTKLQTKESLISTKPSFLGKIMLMIPDVIMQPSLDEVQQILHKSTEMIIDVTKGISSWRMQSRPSHYNFMKAENMQELSVYYRAAVENNEISKLVLVLNSSVSAIAQTIRSLIDSYKEYEDLWMKDKDYTVKEFLKNEVIISDIKAILFYYENLEERINNIPLFHSVGMMKILTDDIKQSLLAEARSWKMQYGNQCRAKFYEKLYYISDFMADNLKKLSRSIADLDDIRNTMSCLENIREQQIDIDNMIDPIEEVYTIFQKFGIHVSIEENEKVDTLRYNFKRLLTKAKEVQENLIDIQDNYKSTLLDGVKDFTIDVTDYSKRYTERGPMTEGIPPKEARDRVLLFKSEFDDLWNKFETYSGGEELFGLPITKYPELHRIKKELSLLQLLYGLYTEVMEGIDDYSNILWSEFDIDKINEQLQDFQLRCRKLPKALREWQAFLDLKKKIDDFNEKCPLLQLMAHKAMLPRHWHKISELINYKFNIDSETFSLRDVIEAPLLKFKDDVEDICLAALKEQDIEAKLKQIIVEWTTKVFSFSTFKNRGEVLLKGQETTDIITSLDDSLMVLGSLLSNRYNAPFKKNIQHWVNQLTTTYDIIENWLNVQNLWIYLEAVFVGGDIAKQLPKEAKRFQNIDKSWVKIMTRAHETPNVVECCTADEVLSQLLLHLLMQLELCQKSLVGYLENKRRLFPRFFFVSDPVLLEILGQASDSHTIQNHLLSIFDNICSVKFSQKEYDCIEAVNSQEGEQILLQKYVMAKGNVEVWLANLMHEQQQSLNKIILQAYNNVNAEEFDLIDFMNKYIAQVALLGLQMIWTRDAEEALSRAAFNRKIMGAANRRFGDILRKLIKQTTYDLTEYQRTKFETLITIHVHQKDIFEHLVKANIKSPMEFEWLKQNRFYYDLDKLMCIIRITDVNFIYQNEFLGCTERLVVTPLTDRCYITLAQAIRMCLGGAPAGPAGTGKTETVKDMGKALGKYVVVFNCSDQMDFRGLGRIFKGLAQSGSWGCFDEFNRINLPVLSVAAQQINIVLTARKERKKQFIFSDGDTVELNPEFGIFITMNPGYAGRQELPENLKTLFRSVAMMVPDRQIIIRVKLASCGFQENIILAQKFFILYKLCEEQLTKQVHYDFGLRNILSVLRTLGSAKRARVGESESSIVMRVLRDMNLSKLIDEDESLFMSLITDLFPDIDLDTATYEKLDNKIVEELENEGLINHPPWKMKIIQLYETQLVRHGIMTLGPSGAGKTMCIQVLMRALTKLGKLHKEMRMNPKAITASQMFGRLDVATNDWTDGIFSTLWRKSLKLAKKGEHIWLILDGPVDAIWIENLNSVLDDNKMLTLANGDRIPMSPLCKIIFETHNVDNASPATVSRNGMVFMSSSGLDWKPLVERWLKTRTKQEQEVLNPLFHKIFEEAWDYVLTGLNPKMIFLQVNYIKQALDILEGLLPMEHRVTVSQEQIEKIFVFAIMWSLGALLEQNERAMLEELLFKNKKILNLPPVKKDEKETIFEYMVNKEGKWEHWSSYVEEYIYPSDSVPEFASILVPNVDNVRTDYLIDLIAKQKKAVLLIGEQGTAKTVIIKSSLLKYDSEKHIYKNISFSSVTTPMMLQKTIESYVDKRLGTTYGPPAGKSMTLFIDDINMPFINEWGDQITNELVRQLMEMKGFYNLDKPGEFTSILDIQFVAAMNHPGGGRNDIPERLKRQFTIYNCTLPSDNSIDKIFGVIACGYFCLSRFNEEIVNYVPKFVSTTRKLWQKIKIKMLPTPAKFHYVFNLRDLSRIWEGILHVERKECSTKRDLLVLWKHECTRVIADRFTNDLDKEWFDDLIKQVASEFLEGESISIPEEAYFVDFLQDEPDIPDDTEVTDDMYEIPKIYEEVKSFDILRERFEYFLKQRNEEIHGGRMDLVFFKDAMIHLIRISRIIRTPKGNALLVGVGGSGKQSLTRLISYIAGYKTFQISLTRSYNINNLIEDLKSLYQIAGEEGKGVTFIFTDNEIKDEAFLEYINNILSSGEVGEKFRSRSLKFPGLISGCTIDWFTQWPKDALHAVASHLLRDFVIECSKEIKKEVIEVMGDFHNSVANHCEDYFLRFRRQTSVTPKSYLSFIDGYKNIYKEKLEEMYQLSDRIHVGLEKLLQASEAVTVLQKELIVMEEKLKIAKSKAEEVLTVVTAKAQTSVKIKEAVEKDKEKAQKLKDEIAADKKLAEDKLEEARPALEEAENALKTIKAMDIATVRKLVKPPHLIQRIMDCVLILFQKPVDLVTKDPERECPKPSWNESLKLLCNVQFLSMLQNFDKDQINGEIIELMAPYLEMEDYNLNNATKVCGNVAGLLSWTIAMCAFYDVNKHVIPLKANLTIQEGKLEQANNELQKAEEELEQKQHELNEAKAEYNNALKKQQNLMDEADRCKTKMNAAVTLIAGLTGERERWTEESKEFKSQINRLVGDALLCTGFLSYMGPFNQEFRILIIKYLQKSLEKKKIPFTLNLKLVNIMIDPVTISDWNLQGLPNDELSIQNGIIVTKAPRYPLLIDPQGQGRLWIKNREKNNDLKVTTLNHKLFRNILEDSLALGLPLLIENIQEELDPILDNVLDKNFLKVGKNLKVKVGDKEVDVMPGFRLYMTTKLPNPSFTPEINAQTSVIDFTVTMKGLEDQLLGRVILTEKQELENERTTLLESVASNKRKMKDLEDTLLHKLTTLKGSLIDDDSLIEVLAITKETAANVSAKLTIATNTEKMINKAREEFRPVATRGSILYFLICDMSMVNIMYQTSLMQFLEIFDRSMKDSEQSFITGMRIKNIIEFLTFEVFQYVCRGLYENHKFLFTLLLALKIDIEQGRISKEEFLIFVRGGTALDLSTVTPKPKDWISNLTWLNLVELSKLQHFQEILVKIKLNDRSWKNWFEKNAPEEEEIPDGYSKSLDTFRKLLLIRCWCPDRTLFEARKYISKALGKRYSEPILLNLENMWHESRQKTPLICLLSTGYDPTNLIQNLAKQKNIECQAISMGQGQEIHAKELIDSCILKGGWSLLQNCHLGLEFMDKVLEILISTQTVHNSFRIWITTEVHQRFPISLLQMSIRYTNEPPQGLKANLKRTYSLMSDHMLEIISYPQWQSMLYGVSFLHGVVQERRKFGPLGWNIPYEFNSLDWSASVQFIQNHLDDMDPKKGVSWMTVHYMIGEVQYGGRVTDDLDKRLLSTLTKVYFGEHMFQDEFSFYIGYRMPRCNKRDEYIKFIEDLPAVDTPLVFGLHNNADITYQSNTTKDILDTILSIQPKDVSSSEEETRESVVYRIAKEMLDKLPSDYDPHIVKARLQKMGPMLSMNIFLRQEIDRMQRVLTLVRNTLYDLHLAINGTIIMNENLRDALDRIYDSRVPTLWVKIGWEATTLGFWFTELLDRNKQLSQWLFASRPNIFWMSGFFNPQGFLTATRQETSHSRKWPLDSVILDNDILKNFKDGARLQLTAKDGVYVHGLYLEGAAWDIKSSNLTESLSKQLFSQLPIIHIYAVDSPEKKRTQVYECPVYKRLCRTDQTYVTSLFLNTLRDPDHWILRGVAILFDIK
ncbi:dynein axonemal heavy chain 8-like isoform X2 [Centruroides vittatus]|uniref:dynein axonemal heavy chain 8-like isoform X2 n=1 Tax=Centruroides vittatus TaxID=120091 RepID=UPI00351040DA